MFEAHVCYPLGKLRQSPSIICLQSHFSHEWFDFLQREERSTLSQCKGSKKVSEKQDQPRNVDIIDDKSSTSPTFIMIEIYAMLIMKQRSSIVMFLHDLCYTLVVDLIVQSSQLVWQALKEKKAGESGRDDDSSGLEL